MAGGHSEPSRHPPAGSGWASRIAVLGVLALLLALVALGSGSSRPGVGGATRPVTPMRAAFSPAALVVPLALASAMLGLLVLLLWSARRRKRPDDEAEWVYQPPPTVWWERALLVAIALLPFGGLVAALWLLHSRSQGQAPLPPPVGTRPSTGTRTPPTLPSVGPTAQGAWPALVIVLAAVALVALAVLGAWLLARHRRPPAGIGAATAPRGRRGQLTGLLTETVEDLRREPDPRRAIVAAYARMERSLLRRGLGRRRAETPLEYLERLLGEAQPDQQPLRRLTGLFEQAKFSHHPVGEAMREQAIDALTALRTSLGSGR